ncbi:MAG: JAB domain-containing protein [Sphingobacteriales bacterium]|nr:JAB domain-containing protein [Sphingobacteriales bacterium]OJV98394.1 MAG: DNA repair protein [Sphingobacteriales bacterium 44-61]
MEQMTMQFPEWTKVAEVELIYKTKVKASERPVIRDSKDTCKILRQIWDENKMEMQEEFKVLFLNRSNKVIGVYDASTGGICGTVADPRLILAAAIKALAVSIILSHNHPSGNLKPSRADEELTLKIKEAAKYHDIKVLDHIIITSEQYYSFADEGLI